jgi:hypothetical protein
VHVSELLTLNVPSGDHIFTSSSSRWRGLPDELRLFVLRQRGIQPELVLLDGRIGMPGIQK